MTKTSFDYDLFVIGVGSGGVRAARMSAAYGARVATAEEKYMGGTCVNVGCIPKKLLVHASHFAEEFEQARGFGWGVAKPAFSWPTLIENKNIEISRLNGIYQGLLESAGVTHFDGRARILDEHHLSISDGGHERQVSAEKILIATGGWPQVPDFPGRDHVITSNEAFFLPELPRRVLVVGGGYIAVEFAGIFNGLGVDTCLAYRGPLFLRGFDIDIRQTVQDELTKKGIKLMFDSRVREIVKVGEQEKFGRAAKPGGTEQPGTTATLGGWEKPGATAKPGEDAAIGKMGMSARMEKPVREEKVTDMDRKAEALIVTFEDDSQLEVDQVLYATGRAPAVRDLGLENVAVKQRDNGAIIIDEEFRTSVPNIFALGDVTDRIQLTPVAIAEAMCFAATQFNDDRQLMDYDGIATAVFCQPNIGTVGLTEDQAIDQCKQGRKGLDIFLTRFRPLKHTLSGADEKTMMKVIVDKATDQVLGVHVVGPEAGEIIQGVAIAIKAGATKQQFDATMAIHPTMAEELVTLREPVANE